MTRKEKIRNKARELGQQYFPDSSNIWARSNVEAVYVENACVEMAEWADQHPNWISVEDELPKKRGQYFVYTAAGQSWQSEWMQDKSGEWHWFCSPMTVGTIANVTHWMPIVPPRKE